jgi:hypothetical protein
MSRSKEALYRESGEADYDEAGSPPAGQSDKDESTTTPVALPDRALRAKRR